MSTIQIRTSVPGPRSRELMRRREAAVVRAAFHATPVFVHQAEGAVIEDVDGNRFIDFAGGIGCLNTGHRSPRVVEAIRHQLDRFLHTSFNVLPYESYVALAEQLNEITPGKFAKKTVLVNSGAEAVENAIKIARAYTKRPAILAFEDAFHGRTYMAMAATSKTHPYKAGFEPFPGDVYRAPFAYCYRCSYSLEYPSCEIHCARQIEDTFKRVVAAESVAAVIVEPVMGEGGFITPPPEFFPILGEICRKHGILLIADEVQTGFARTGAMFACERLGLEPDLITMAKSLSGGLPLAAVTGRAEIMDTPGIGALGGTFGGNPAACEAALAVLETIAAENLCARANQLGERFRRRAAQWQSRWEIIGDVRGLGAMQAFELVRSREAREPADEETRHVAQYCYEHGLILITAGTFGNVIRLLMPLVITDAQTEEALDVLESALAAVSEKKGAVAQLV
ncbi:MAG TPA: 4-aminobutyrate--2-oxoglutarate transaminase [Candidatus Aquilonibacter sp.]|nr:4-aminobutyrate--2-oxoglutarate transaminase [Candidatus Aquilonibacter sp.]